MNFHIAFCAPHAAAVRHTGNRGEESAVKKLSKQVYKKGGKAKTRFASLFDRRKEESSPPRDCKGAASYKSAIFHIGTVFFAERGKIRPYDSRNRRRTGMFSEWTRLFPGRGEVAGSGFERTRLFRRG